VSTFLLNEPEAAPREVTPEAAAGPVRPAEPVGAGEPTRGSVPEPVWVPEAAPEASRAADAPRVFVSGDVRRPGAYAWLPGLTARQLLAAAGGLAPGVSDARLGVASSGENRRPERTIELDTALEAGDKLIVHPRAF
jgi:hypothetical protein